MINPGIKVKNPSLFFSSFFCLDPPTSWGHVQKKQKITALDNFRSTFEGLAMSALKLASFNPYGS